MSEELKELKELQQKCDVLNELKEISKESDIPYSELYMNELVESIKKSLDYDIIRKINGYGK